MIKRGMDFVLSLLGLVVLSPIFFILSLIIRFADGGPAFFVQTRVGRDGVPFRMLKFRSMAVGAEKGAALTVGKDARVTAVGKVLRRSKLDELPQLINVLMGDMSFVGPRPEAPVFVDAYTSAQREVLRLQPGITDPASFIFFNESELLASAADPERFYIEQVMAEKIRINLAYARRSGALKDLLLIVATVGKAMGIHVDIIKWLHINLPKLKVGP